MYCPKTRYCPSCDLAGLIPYTVFTNPGSAIEFCERDINPLQKNNSHRTFVAHGAYAFSPIPFDKLCKTGCCEKYPNDDGVECCSPSLEHVDLWELLVGAIEKEAAAGIFDPDMWAPTFPRRAAELVKKSREVAVAALVDKLPAVLVGVVVSYVWAS
jgi:hypothetical protein